MDKIRRLKGLGQSGIRAIKATKGLRQLGDQAIKEKMEPGRKVNPVTVGLIPLVALIAPFPSWQILLKNSFHLILVSSRFPVIAANFTGYIFCGLV
jgi:hypothetical protein